MINSPLKWVGGKGRVMSELLNYLPKSGEFLIEPFVGGASVFLNTDYDRYVLADINPDLINFYQQVKSNHDALIAATIPLFTAHNNEADYYLIRSQFNNGTSGLQRAALFLYLNRHGYRGVCRYNQSGVFNTPFGDYKRVYFPEKEIILFAEKAKRAVICCCDFRELFEDRILFLSPPKNTAIYCDPPYLPLSKTANFTGYHSSPFGIDEHRELNDVLVTMVGLYGIHTVISNSQTPDTQATYPRFDFNRITAPRNIHRKAGTHKHVEEVIGVLNYESLHDSFGVQRGRG